MSQEKVDRYKEQKANRKQIMRRQKTVRAVRTCVLALVAVALLGWLGYSAWDLYEDSRPRKVAEVDYSAVDEYLSSLDYSSAEEE